MSTKSEMELRVMNALAMENAKQKGNWTALSPFARAAIQAMRQPTMEMVEAAAKVKGCGANITGPWQAMIDAASPPTETGR